jgi:hypothetical protein
MAFPPTVTNLVVLARLVTTDLLELLLLTREVNGPTTYGECLGGGVTSTMFYPVRDDLRQALGEDAYASGECFIVAGGQVVSHVLINLVATLCNVQPVHDVARLVSGQPVEDCPALIRRIAAANGYAVAALVRRPL